MNRDEWRIQRLHNVNKGDDYHRKPFERDRERLVHSPALRRLAGVTQVVNAGEGPVFHNRLTHTLKVMQIGRRLAEKLLRTEAATLIEELGGLDVNVVEAAALAHDLGHPPFGHSGERKLNELVQRRGEQVDDADKADGYEGNAQSFRIVTKLEVRWHESLGLDLTKATLNAILKYPWLKKDQPHHFPLKKPKWGAYTSESWELEQVRALDKHTDRMCLEAAIMDWADDIAYAIHDVDDFYKAGLIPLDRLWIETTFKEDFKQQSQREQSNDSQQMTGERTQFLQAVSEWRKIDGDDYTPDAIAEAFDRLIFTLPLYQPYRATRQQLRQLRIISAQLINTYIERTTLNPAAIDDSQQPFLNILPDLVREVKILKDLTRYYVINSHTLMMQQYGEKQIIERLFKCYFEEASTHKRPRSAVVQSILPPDFDTLLQEAEDAANNHPDGYATDAARHARVVADVVSRMTDGQAWKVYQRLSGIQQGSLIDHLF